MKKTFKKLTAVFVVLLLVLSNVFMTLAEDTAETSGSWYVAGTANLCNGEEWVPGAEVNKMTYNEETGLYEITFEQVEASSFEFKVTNGSWDECYPADNVKGGLSAQDDVLVMFDAETKEVSWYSDSEGEPPVPEEVFYRVAGSAGLCTSEWNATDDNNLMSYNSLNARYEKIYTGIAAGSYEYKVVKNGSDWMPEDNQIVEVAEDGATVVIWYDEATGEIGSEVSKDLVIKFYYNRPDGNYENWSLWNWDDVGTSATDTPFAADAEGKMVVTYKVAPAASQVGFIVRDPNWTKDPDGDRFVDVSKYVSGELVVYLESGESAFEVDDTNAVAGAKISKAVSEGGNTITVTASMAIENYADAFTVMCEGETVVIASVAEGTEANTYVITLEEDLDLTKAYTVLFNGNSFKVTQPSLYKSESFIEEYTYTGEDLGATWTKDKTTFKVWAPTASDVKLNLYKGGEKGVDDLLTTVQMNEAEQGVWVVEIADDLNGVYYTYSVNNSGEVKEACDPYARTTGVNGDRAMVINLDSTDPAGWENDSNPNADLEFTDAVIYELHVRDASIDESSGVSEENKGNFLGLIESGTTTEGGVATVLDHMVDLGITHLHLLPAYDFSSVDETEATGDQFNWGYDPKNYNVPEGSYSSDPYNGEVRVNEMKQMVQGLHENGISVVMDVVYNHVADAGNFCFNQIVPDYFSRKLENGGYSSNSGCGNDTASEHVMVRKYIVDSVKYWADEYHIDGFRFDLVGLIDTVTINEIMKEVWSEHPDVVFYGEGWEMNSYDTGVPMTTQGNSTLVQGENNTRGFAFFNDTLRDAIKGSVFDYGTGYVSGTEGLEATIEDCFIGLPGDWCTTPTQTINYNSCHDNNTLYDRLVISRPDASKEQIIDMNNLAAAITITSQGVPFVHAGEEFLRSKPDESNEHGYNHNSYDAGDAINSIKWDTLEETDEQEVYEYYKGLIAFRKAHAALRMTTAEEVTENILAIDGLDKNVTAFAINGGVNGEVSDGLFLIFNPNEEATEVELPDGKWNVYVNAQKAGTEVLDTVSRKVSVDGISAMILVQESDAPTSPATADGAQVVTWMALIVLSAVTVVFTKKSKRA